MDSTPSLNSLMLMSPAHANKHAFSPKIQQTKTLGSNSTKTTNRTGLGWKQNTQAGDVDGSMRTVAVGVEVAEQRFELVAVPVHLTAQMDDESGQAGDQDVQCSDGLD
jgi:hypothetical protein